MWKAFRGLLTFNLPNLGVMLGFAVVSTIGAYVTDVPDGADNLFRTYFLAFPLLCLLFLFMFGFSLSTANLNILLSFGCRRRDYFLGLQAMMAVYVLTSAVLSFLMSMLPLWQNWSDRSKLLFVMRLGGQQPWIYCLGLVTALVVGCLSGLVFDKSRVWGTVLLTGGILATIAAMVLLMLTSLRTGDSVVLHSVDGMTPDVILPGDGVPLWGDLPLILTAALVAIVAAGEIFLRRFIVRFSVR